MIREDRRPSVQSYLEMRSFRLGKDRSKGFQVATKFTVFHKLYIIINDNTYQEFFSSCGTFNGALIMRVLSMSAWFLASASFAGGLGCLTSVDIPAGVPRGGISVSNVFMEIQLHLV